MLLIGQPALHLCVVATEEDKVFTVVMMPAVKRSMSLFPCFDAVGDHCRH